MLKKWFAGKSLTFTFALLGVVLFLLGVGLYASLRCRTITAAVVWTFGGLFLSKLVLWWPLAAYPAALLGVASRTAAGDRCPWAYVVVPAILYGGVGLLLLWRTARNLRRDVFG